MSYGISMMKGGRRGISGPGEVVHNLQYWRGSPPSPLSQTFEFRWFFESIRLGGDELIPSDVDLFASGVDNWGAAVVGGHYDQAAQAQALGAHSTLDRKFGSDPKAKFWLDQSKKTLDAIPASVKKQTAEGRPPVADPAPAMSAGAAVATGFGFFGVALALGLGYLAFAGGKKK